MATKLLLVDGTNLYFRSYYAMKYSGLQDSEGHLTFAIHGFIRAMSSVIKRYNPTHILIAFDYGKSAYRRAIFPEYKAARKSDSHPEDGMIDQLKKSQELLKLLNVFTHKEYQVEADDIIATCVHRWKSEVDNILILSGDKDVIQLVDTNVHVQTPSLGGKASKAEKFWTIDEVVDKYGVTPDRLIEIWALCGDDGDGVPGVRGVGEKTAIKLIEKYGNASAVAMSGEKKVTGQESAINQAYKLIHLDGRIAQCPFSLRTIEFKPVRYGHDGATSVNEFLKEHQLDVIARDWRQGALWKDHKRHLLDKRRDAQVK